MAGGFVAMLLHATQQAPAGFGAGGKTESQGLANQDSWT